MSKLLELIHGRKIKQNKSEVYCRFAKQNDHRNIFYVVLNGIAMPVAY